MTSMRRWMIGLNTCREYLAGYACLLWFIDGNPRLSPAARVLIERQDSQPFLSMASLWEIAIKISLGKLQLEQSYEAFIPQQLAMNGIGILNFSLEHIAAIATLPFHHRDPFDRLIAVQSKIEKMTLVSADPSFDVYEVERVW